MREEVAADENAAMMVDYFTWDWHNRWLLLQRLVTEGELDILLSPMTVFWLSKLNYERIEALVKETQGEADKANGLEAWWGTSSPGHYGWVMYLFVLGKLV